MTTNHHELGTGLADSRSAVSPDTTQPHSLQSGCADAQNSNTTGPCVSAAAKSSGLETLRIINTIAELDALLTEVEAFGEPGCINAVADGRIVLIPDRYSSGEVQTLAFFETRWWHTLAFASSEAGNQLIADRLLALGLV